MRVAGSPAVPAAAAWVAVAVMAAKGLPVARQPVMGLAVRGLLGVARAARAVQAAKAGTEAGSVGPAAEWASSG